MARRSVSFGDAMRLFGSGGTGDRSGGRAAGPSTPSGASELPSETVTELAARIKGALESLGDPIRVRGEISNFTDKGHWYFSLKDDSAVVGCAMWQEQARRVGWTPKEGDAVVATGSVSFFAKQGRAQFYVRSIERVGLGSLQERFEALCRELRGLGYFDDGRKLALPSFPRRVAIVTSATGAAVHDCLRTAAHRCPAVGILLVDVRVQGDGAAGEVARAIRALDRHAGQLGIDAILVTRGGGSIEDLWAFNERLVADAVFARTRVPVVAAIGHESDTTIVELVADRRASTPTQAMMLLTPDRAELAEQVESNSDRLGSSLRRAIRERRDIVTRIGRHAFLRSPLAPLVVRRDRLGALARRLQFAMQQRLNRWRSAATRAEAVLAAQRPEAKLDEARRRDRERARRLERGMSEQLRRSREALAALERHFESVSPNRVLSRGFSYTRTADGALVRSVVDAPSGARLLTTVADGTIASTVIGDGPSVDRGAITAPSSPRAAEEPRPSRRRTPGGGDGLSLFGSSPS